MPKYLPLLLSILLVTPWPAPAQVEPPTQANRPLLTRDALERLLLDLEALAASGPADSRAEARRQAEDVRTRLAEGDFRTGDRIALLVEAEEELTDTFTVDLSRSVALPAVGRVSLEGVLRSELQDHLTQYLQRFLRNPVVRAQSLMRVSILGAVASPGFYTVASEEPITDAIMLAGGPITDARMDELTIERGGDVLWEGDALQLALQEGRTLDQMSLRPGDQIRVPQSGAGLAGGEGILRTVALFLSIPLTIFAVIQIF